MEREAIPGVPSCLGLSAVRASRSGEINGHRPDTWLPFDTGLDIVSCLEILASRAENLECCPGSGGHALNEGRLI